MEDKKHQKILSYIWSLKERAEKLRKGASDWEVNVNISKKRIKKIDAHSKFLGQIIKISLKPELTEKERKQLIRLTKRRLSSLRKHFLSVYNIIQKNPSRVWDKKIKSTERELEERLVLYEKVVPLLFRKKLKRAK
ncbi:hypothetical protein KJA15_01550 [Patescibacteria group bacterium]|nr:hypothetical protein [Patescibacteria group bacterium]